MTHQEVKERLSPAAAGVSQIRIVKVSEGLCVLAKHGLEIYMCGSTYSRKSVILFSDASFDQIFCH